MFWGRRKTKQVRGFRKREIKIVNKPVYENPYFERKNPGFVLRLIRNPKKALLILLIFGLFYFLFYASYFKINQVDIQGLQELTHDQVRYEVNKAFVLRRFVILRQSNLFVYNSKAAKDMLWNTFALEEISIKKRLPNRIVVTIKEKIPNLTLINKDHYFYLDLKGTVTHIVPKEEVKEHFPVVLDLNERTIRLKNKILPEKTIDAIFELNESFPAKTNSDIEQFRIPEINCPKEAKPEPQFLNTNANLNVNSANGNQSLNANLNVNKNVNLNSNTNSSTLEEECDKAAITNDIIVLSVEGWKAYFTVIDNIATQLERLKIYLLRKAIDNETRDNIDYIDLRYGEKIFLKEK